MPPDVKQQEALRPVIKFSCQKKREAPEADHTFRSVYNIGKRRTCQSTPNRPSPKREEFRRNCWFLQQKNCKKNFFRR